MNSSVNQRYLIIEDEEEIRDFLLRILIDNIGIPNESIEEATYLNEAKTIIDEFDPNIVLLDLKIPRDKDYEPDMINAFELIQYVELYNFRQHSSKDKIKIIVISGSVEDRGVRQILKMDKSRIFDFYDKGEIARDVAKFETSLKRKIEKAIEFRGEVQSIDYTFVRKGVIKKLEEIRPELWQKIDEQILKPFENISDIKLNEANIAKSIIINCGELVEDIIALYADRNQTIGVIEYTINDNSVLKKLTKLSGRKFVGWDKENNNEPKFEVIGNNLIRRISQEYAHKAYQLSSQARHSKEGDERNNKWFSGYNAGFTKEDAALSINLIVPLIQDFIYCFENE